MKTTYCVFMISYGGEIGRVYWPGEQDGFDTEALAIVAVKKRIKQDKPLNNNFSYVVLPMYGQP